MSWTNKPKTWLNRPTNNEWFTNGEDLVKDFSYSDPVLQDVLDRVRALRIMTRLKERENDDGTFGKALDREFLAGSPDILFHFHGVDFKLRLGGLHSSDPPGIFEADEDFLIRDFDAASFYPAMIINQKIIPRHLDVKRFLFAYDHMRQRRLEAKAAGKITLSNGLKIGLNSVFGKFINPYSPLLDPHAGLMVTIRGELTLLAFLELAAAYDVLIISVNTDGFMLRIPRDIADQLTQDMNEMAGLLGFDLEHKDYVKILRAAGNDYIAVPVKGELKTKGRYGYDKSDMGKQSKIKIVIDAATAFLVHDTPIADTIKGSTEITDFIDWFQCDKGWTLTDDHGSHGRLARWYIGTAKNNMRKVKDDGKVVEMKSWQDAVICNDLPSEFPADINLEFYAGMATELVHAITEPHIKYDNSMEIKDLTRAQLDRIAYTQHHMVPDTEYLATITLDNAQEAYDTQRGIGNRYDAMRAVLTSLWFAQKGRLTQGDLIWLMDDLDSSTGYFQRPDKRKSILSSIEWITKTLIPYKKPQTVEDMVRHAMIHAGEHREGNGTARLYVHKTSQDKFYAGGPIYPFIYSICAQSVKHKFPLDEAGIIELIRFHCDQKDGKATVETWQPYSAELIDMLQKQNDLASKRRIAMLNNS